MLLVWKSILSDEKQKRQTGKVPMRLRFIRFAAPHAFSVRRKKIDSMRKKSVYFTKTAVKIRKKECFYAI